MADKYLIMYKEENLKKQQGFEEQITEWLKQYDGKIRKISYSGVPKYEVEIASRFHPQLDEYVISINKKEQEGKKTLDAIVVLEGEKKTYML